jgi:hypothetical protein
MLICICNSTLKILGERNIEKEVEKETISMFLNEYFTDESIIDYQYLLKWCYRVPLVEEFFHLIDKNLIKKKRIY